MVPLSHIRLPLVSHIPCLTLDRSHYEPRIAQLPTHRDLVPTSRPEVIVARAEMTQSAQASLVTWTVGQMICQWPSVNILLKSGTTANSVLLLRASGSLKTLK